VIIPNRNNGAFVTVLCKVTDDRQGSAAKRLSRTSVQFSDEHRRCKLWYNKPPTRQCSICQRWGHTHFTCRARSPYCTRCTEPHPTSAHMTSCKGPDCQAGCKCSSSCCINCDEEHPAMSPTCAYARVCNDREVLSKLYKQKRASKGLPQNRSSTTRPPPGGTAPTPAAPPGGEVGRKGARRYQIA
jgi:hypothetical protein